MHRTYVKPNPTQTTTTLSGVIIVYIKEAVVSFSVMSTPFTLHTLISVFLQLYPKSTRELEKLFKTSPLSSPAVDTKVTIKCYLS